MTEPFRTTVIFEEHGNQTKLSMVAIFRTAQARDEVAEKHGAVEGMHQHVDRLAEYLRVALQMDSNTKRGAK